MWEDNQFARLNWKLDILTWLVRQLLKQEAKLAIDLTSITAAVNKNTEVDASVEQLLTNLTALIKAIPPSTDPTTQAALDQLTATLTANNDKIAADVVANTPAAP